MSTSHEDEGVESPVNSRGQQQEFYGEIIGMNQQNEERERGHNQDNLDDISPLSSPPHTPLISVSSSISNQPPTVFFGLESINSNESTISRSNINSSTSLVYDKNDINSDSYSHTELANRDNHSEEELNELNSEILKISEEFDESDNGSDYDENMANLRWEKNSSFDVDKVLRRRNKVVHNSDI